MMSARSRFFPFSDPLPVPSFLISQKTAAALKPRGAQIEPEIVLKNCIQLQRLCVHRRFRAKIPGSARVSRVGCGVTPQQVLLMSAKERFLAAKGEVRDGEDAVASTRDACATRKILPTHSNPA